mmetsp:Transcript_23077/g.34970  ORF Transcript_23077/g.34970 Transcript_23077/m.34970 type:complete len:806 (-) Transcript_23077:576-2993(-)
MKLILPLVTLLCSINAEGNSLRNRKLLGKGTLDYFECILIERTTDFDDDDDEFDHICLGDPEEDGDYDMMYSIIDYNDVIPDLDIDGLDIMENPGRYKLILTNVIENTEPIITTTPETKVDIIDLEDEFDEKDELSEGRRLVGGPKLNGRSSLAVIRLTVNGNQPAPSADELAFAWFGVGGNPQSFVTRYEECSFKKLMFEPASGNGFRNGVIEISVNKAINGQSTEEMIYAGIGVLKRQLGFHPDTKYDHMAYILPPGSDMGRGPGKWVAFAYQGSNLSAFNDKQGLYLTHQVHEIGHNLGLVHSSHGSQTYGDQSGYMGYGYSLVGGPQMCFNGAKSWQLGWYRDKSVEVDVGALRSRSVYLTFFGDYDRVSKGSNSEGVLIKVGKHILMFNKRTGINSETQEFPDKVTVTYWPNRVNPSVHEAALSPGGKFSFDADGTQVTVEHCRETQQNGASKAMMSIYAQGSSSTCNNFDSGLDGGSRPVAAPVPAPTRQPVPPPTRQPVPPPTNQPVPAPADSPTPRGIGFGCEGGEMKVDLRIFTNNSPDKITWKLKVRRGEILERIDGYENSNYEYFHSYCVDVSKTLEFHLNDLSGMENPGGRYTLSVDDEVYSEGDIVPDEVDYVQGPCVIAGQSRMQFILNTGLAADKIDWSLDVNGNNKYNGGPWSRFPGRNLHFFSNTCLDSNQCYTLIMRSSREGSGGLDRGSYEINWDDKNEKFSTFESGDEEVTHFGKCDGSFDQQPQNCNCSDNPIGWMENKGWRCQGSIYLEKKCNKNAHWTDNKYCQLSCYQAGFGYPGDECVCT